jgi:hypothetical protein
VSKYTLPRMKRKLSMVFFQIIFISFILGNFIIATTSLSQTILHDAFAHQLFNSSGQKIGNYYVQVATDPEIPTTGENTKIMMRVSSVDGTELSDVPISISISRNGQEIEKIPQIIVTEGHHELDYKFLEPGNYVFYVYLQDIYFSGETITYIFNISTLNPFGYIFYSLITFAVVTPLVVIAIIYVTNKRRSSKQKISENKSV